MRLISTTPSASSASIATWTGTPLGVTRDLLRRHARMDGGADGGFRDAEAGEDFRLAVVGRAAVIAHRRDDDRVAAARAHERGRGADDVGDAIDAAAADADDDALAVEARVGHGVELCGDLGGWIRQAS